MPGRVKINAYAGGPDGAPIAGATLAVRDRITSAAKTVYAAESEADLTALSVAQTVSDASGDFPGWTTRGSLEGTVTYPAPTGLAPKLLRWEAYPAADDRVDANHLDDDATTAGYVAQRNADGSVSWVPARTMSGSYSGRPAASTALNGVRYFATDKRMEFECIAGAWVLVGALETQVLAGVALPSSPIDEQAALIEWAPPGGDAQGSYTRAKYRMHAGSTYRWVCQGGVMALAASALQTVPTSTPVVLGGMTWTATYSGLYKLGFSVLVVINASVHTGNVDLYVGGTKVDGRSAPGNAGWGPTIALVPRPFVVLAGQTVDLRGYGDGTQDFKDRELTIEPVRLLG